MKTHFARWSAVVWSLAATWAGAAVAPTPDEMAEARRWTAAKMA